MINIMFYILSLLGVGIMIGIHIDWFWSHPQMTQVEILRFYWKYTLSSIFLMILSVIPLYFNKED